MKARIPDNEYDTNAIGMLDKLMSDKQFAETFYNYLTEKHPDKPYESFEEWYNRLSTANFLNKVRKAIEIPPNRETRRAAKKKGGE